MTGLFRYEDDDVDIGVRDLSGLEARLGVVLDIGGKMLSTLTRDHPSRNRQPSPAGRISLSVRRR